MASKDSRQIKVANADIIQAKARLDQANAAAARAIEQANAATARAWMVRLKQAMGTMEQAWTTNYRVGVAMTVLIDFKKADLEAQVLVDLEAQALRLEARVVGQERSKALSELEELVSQVKEAMDAQEEEAKKDIEESHSSRGSKSSKMVEKKGNKPKSKRGGGSKRRKKGKRVPASPPPLTQEQLVERWQQEHSRTLTLVLDELGPLLKSIRKRLNDLAIKKSAPKVRGPKNPEEKRPAAPPRPAGAKDGLLGGKGGKVAYPVLVGDVTGLYKTSSGKKSGGRRGSAKSNAAIASTAVIDLHGHTSEEALEALDAALPAWVNNAMEGAYPWVIPVDIICGGGGQVLAEAVRGWICSKRQVANRPKGFV